MEVKQVKHEYFHVLFFTVLYFAIVYRYNSWLFSYSDIPIDDEYGLICFTLGKCGYGSAVLYQKILWIFSLFTKDFFELFKMNFFVVHLFFPIVFFLYNMAKKIPIAFNYFFTTLTVLSPYNVIITRKIHFWELLALLLALLISHFVKHKRYFLLLVFAGLMFLRVSFLFPLSVCIFIILLKDYKVSIRSSALWAIALMSILVIGVLFTRPDMLRLAQSGGMLFNIKNNFHHYFITNIQLVYNLFYTFKFDVIALFVSVYLVRKIHFPFGDSFEDVLIVSSLVIPLFFIIYLQGYNVILFFALVFFLTNSFNPKKISKIFSILLYLVSIFTLLFVRPQLISANHFYPMNVAKGQDNLFFATYLKYFQYPIGKVVKVASEQDLSMLIPNKNIKFSSFEKKYSSNCIFFQNGPDIVFIFKPYLKEFLESNDSCLSGRKYKIEKVLENHFILNSVSPK